MKDRKDFLSVLIPFAVVLLTPFWILQQIKDAKNAERPVRTIPARTYVNPPGLGGCRRESESCKACPIKT